MKVSLQKFSDNFPKEVVDLLQEISTEGFTLTLVGGAVRDYYLDKSISKDLDFEIRHEHEFTGKEWLDKISTLGHKLKENYEVEELKFSILRIPVGEFEVELSSPRKETYSKDATSFGHSDFELTFSSKYTYEESFKRRDFTLNALGIEFGVNGKDYEFKLIDPYNGLRDLKLKELCNISDDFYKDPVRFLRTLRFKISKGLELSRNLKDNIVYFNLKKLSLHYFVQEGRKVGIERLIDEMNFSKRKFAVDLPAWARHFDKILITENSCLDVDDVAFHSLGNMSDEELMDLGSDFNIKKSLIRNFLLIGKLLEIDLNEVVKKSKNNNFEDIQNDEELLLLSKVKSLSDSTLTKYLSKIDPNILKLVNEKLKDNVEFTQLSKTTNPKLRSSLGIYCHLRKM